MPVRSLPRPVEADWRVRGNCRRLRDPDVMTPHPTDEKGIAAAKRVCVGCPVVAECLNDAIRWGDRHGVRGALTPAERGAPAVLSRRVGAAATRVCRYCGVRRPAGQVVERRCKTCTNARPPTVLLGAADAIAELKQKRASDRVIGLRFGCSAAEVSAARRELGIDSYGMRRTAVAA